MQPFEFHAGDTPLLVSIPHAGTYLPDDLRATLSEEALRLPDTDWHVDRLYEFVRERGASVLRANYSRLCIDLNRPPDDAPLYAGATTGLFPDLLFDGQPVFRDGAQPVRARFVETVWQPYHRRLQAALDALRQRFGYAVLLDAHSIRSVIPRLFDGTLPDFNIGTNDGRSTASGLEERVAAVCRSDSDYSTVVNGRFKGGYTTRHYGDPAGNVHAVQLELAQKTYMDEYHPFAWRPRLAERLQRVLIPFVEAFLDWSPPPG